MCGRTGSASTPASATTLTAPRTRVARDPRHGHCCSQIQKERRCESLTTRREWPRCSSAVDTVAGRSSEHSAQPWAKCWIRSAAGARPTIATIAAFVGSSHLAMAGGLVRDGSGNGEGRKTRTRTSDVSTKVLATPQGLKKLDRDSPRRIRCPQLRSSGTSHGNGGHDVRGRSELLRAGCLGVV